MKPLALHRSLSFWSGVLVMTFLAWAWRDSTRARHWADHQDWLFSNDESRVVIGHVRMDKRYWIFPENWDENSHRMQLQPPRLLRHLGGDFLSGTNPVRIGGLGEVSEKFDIDHRYLQKGLQGDWALFIPHWLILGGVAVPWLALLAWRARRKRRLANPEVSP